MPVLIARVEATCGRWVVVGVSSDPAEEDGDEVVQPYMGFIESLKLIAFHADIAAEMLTVNPKAGKRANAHYERMGEIATRVLDAIDARDAADDDDAEELR